MTQRINIIILNDNGEMLDKQLSFDSIDAMRVFLWEDKNIDALIDEAKKNGEEEGKLDVEEKDEDLI
jgi:hypothetical protein